MNRSTPVNKTPGAAKRPPRRSPADSLPATLLQEAVRHLEAGEWEAAHDIVQKDASALGCWAHGIAHLLEGDLPNAQYWYRRAHRLFPHLDNARAEIAALKEALDEPRGTASVHGRSSKT
jgi:hypothetical protein